MIEHLSLPSALGIAAAAIIAQVILPAAFDLIASLAIFGCGATIGWRAKKA
ncbi:hypothetical protein [Paracoccus aminophilus]|uniref:Uncharacterized protein n=1 Tax=Paracoccus aminophilus JCM 7686 TaxID=1367847 RepID=S5XKZ4_PARAH|nr:hypothetical protein [Paracoccus aminophilus]AGT07884.1 hypothetical protein JCM7686_0775 [Paracoccus aminophilus JCM 7686]